MTPARPRGARPPHERPARAARGVLAATVATLVALGAHLASGGSAPPVMVVLAATVLSWPAAVLLAGARPRLWRQALTIALAQLLLHGTFALGAGAAVSGRPAATDGMSGMAGMSGMPGMGEMPGMGGMPGMPGMGGMPASAGAMAHGSSATMWLGHGVAWLLTVAAWRWGEQAAAVLVGLGAGALALVGLLLAAPAAVRSQQAAVAIRRRTPALPLDVVVLRHPRRGPPCSA